MPCWSGCAGVSWQNSGHHCCARNDSQRFGHGEAVGGPLDLIQRSSQGFGEGRLVWTRQNSANMPKGDDRIKNPLNPRNCCESIELQRPHAFDLQKRLRRHPGVRFSRGSLVSGLACLGARLSRGSLVSGLAFVWMLSRVSKVEDRSDILTVSWPVRVELTSIAYSLNLCFQSFAQQGRVAQWESARTGESM